MAHLAVRESEVGWSDVRLRVCLLLLLLRFASSFWRKLTFTLSVLSCCDCLPENVAIVLVKIEKGMVGTQPGDVCDTLHFLLEDLNHMFKKFLRYFTTSSIFH